MSVRRVSLDQPVLDDLELARQLGRRLWDESDLQFDFGAVQSVAPEFAEELCRVIVDRRSPAVLSNTLLVHTMAPPVQATFLPAIMAALGGGPLGRPAAREESSVSTSVPAAPERPAAVTLNPFAILESVQQDYLTYVRTFQRFQNPRIRDWVMDRIEHGTLLWKPPYIQLSRPFAPGDTLETLVEEGLLHSKAPPIFRRDPDDPASLPVHPYRHQSEAVRRILGSPPLISGEGLGEGANVVVATGTGSGKSFAFGIPIVSQSLRMREQGIPGIKAVIVYPMNALANSQYDDFAQRLHGTGLTIARYTGDTAYSPEEALDRYQRATGRLQPYNSEILSREEIQDHPPDILMTNYVMLELLLTRFEDRRLFARPDVLRFMVLDEVHTYTGQRGADVAALIRRLKQHTHTVSKLRCIATSATVESAGDVSAAEAVASFVQKLFGEPFSPNDVVTETYAPLPDDLPPLTRAIAKALGDGPRTLHQLADDLDVTPDQIEDTLLSSSDQQPVSKVHAFFSQGRGIAACLDQTEPHLNDRGERICPVCAEAGREDVPTFPLVFCRACGQEFWSVAVDQEGHLHPADLDAVDVPGRLGYLLSGHPEIDLPEHWLTPTGKVRGGKRGYEDVVPEQHTVCPVCGRLDSDRDHAQRDVTFMPAPFLLCPNCGIVHDRRPREYNKLFTFGSVGRSTATDVLVSAQVQALPEAGRKVIAFSDNRQDTALQAAHMTSLHNRITFRQALYTMLRESHATVDSDEWLDLAAVGLRIFDTQARHGVQPPFLKDQRAYGKDWQAQHRYQRYLQFVALRELRGTHRRTHQNLEDVGLLVVGYNGLDECTADDAFWDDVPVLADLDADTRHDLLLGFLDLMRKRLAIAHEAALRPNPFHTEVLSRLSEAAFVHDETFRGPIGYSDSAERGWGYTVYRFTGSNTQPVVWVKRALSACPEPFDCAQDRPVEGVDHATAVEIVERIVGKLSDPRAAFLVRHTVKHYRRRYDLWMVNPEVITLQADTAEEQWTCPKCGTVHRFRTLRVCTGSTCRTTLDRRDLGANYFRQVYALPLGEAVPVRAEEHSGQVSGQERREIELRFRDPEDPLNVLICTPTMELGIDIGHLNAVMLRNVPPSPSNYAQRAGRAGRSGQPALITVFAGVGSARGPHDQYFYRFPEKMIAGAIAAPRFRLENEALIRTHVHALVLETMGLLGAERLPSRPRELLNLDGRGKSSSRFPLYDDWKTAYQAGIDRHFSTIVEAVEEAFAEEIGRFDWFDRAYVEAQVRNFVTALDRAMDRWRDEYVRLDAERQMINRQLGREGVKPGLDRRRVVIENKLQAMREGRGDWYVYRYLGGEGFLPGYAFPPQATVLAFNDREAELARDPVIALTEYAPGNFIYYRGQRYEVTHARPRTRRRVSAEGEPEAALEVIPMLVCPACGRAYRGSKETKRAACVCGHDLRAIHPRQGMPLSDMFAQQRARITADEEERLRLGYEVTSHYMAGGRRTSYRVVSGTDRSFRLTVEHGGRVLLLNRGTRQQEDEPQGFTLCCKCHAWLMGDDAAESHVGTNKQQGKCSHGARRPEDLLRDLWLTKEIRSDLVLLDVPLPEALEDGESADEFYTTLLHTWLRALLVAFNLDESELDGFLAPSPEANDGISYRVVLYETTVGGSGVLASLAEPGRLTRVIERARELLHEGDPEGGCEKACYACLLSFYNQRDHELLDRTLVLPWLQSLEGIAVERVDGEDEADRFDRLLSQCQSSFEREVLQAIHDAKLPLPDEAQKTVYDGDEPITTSDFFYAPRLLVFVDGSPHYREYVQAADERKRHRLRALGYRILAITSEDIDGRLEELAVRLG